VLVHQVDGNPGVRIRGSATAATQGNVNFPLIIPQAGGSTRRWQNPRASMRATDLLYASIFDADTRNVVLVARYGTTNRQRTVNPGGSNASPFSAVGYDATGPIVAFFNRTENVLQIAAANHLAGATDTQNNTWQTSWNNFGVRNVPNSSSASHVSMAIDRNNNLHLAFVNDGAVVYAFSSNRGASFTTMVVDNLRGAGSWTDISVDHWGNPWIVYGVQAREGGVLPDSVRIAYRTHNANGAGRSGHRFTTGNNDIWDIANWEAVQMAAPFVVSYDRLNIETWPPSNRANPTLATPLTMASGLDPAARAWSAAIGYIGTGQGGNSANDTSFRIGYFFNPAALD